MNKTKYKAVSFQEWLCKITVVIDTQEKNIKHITESFKEMNVKFTFAKLESGDYSYFVNSYHSNVVIERKNSLEEVSNNFGKFRDRFEREFTRTYKKVNLVFEHGNYNDVMMGNYCSKFNTESLLASFLVFERKYNINTYFVSKATFAKFILKLLYYQDYYVRAKQKESEEKQ